MESIVIDINNKEIINIVLDIFGKNIKEEFIESKQLDGDIEKIISSIVISVTSSILATLILNSLEPKKDEDTNQITVVYNNQYFVVKDENLTNIKKVLQEIQDNRDN